MRTTYTLHRDKDSIHYIINWYSHHYDNHVCIPTQIPTSCQWYRGQKWRTTIWISTSGQIPISAFNIANLETFIILLLPSYSYNYPVECNTMSVAPTNQFTNNKRTMYVRFGHVVVSKSESWHVGCGMEGEIEEGGYFQLLGIVI